MICFRLEEFQFFLYFVLKRRMLTVPFQKNSKSIVVKEQIARPQAFLFIQHLNAVCNNF